MNDALQHNLRERVKELTALHRTARLLHDRERPFDEVMSDVVELLPPAWQYPEITEGRVTCGEQSWATEGYGASPWRQCETFALRDGERGAIEVVYREQRPPAAEGPFLDEERDLIRSLAEMLRSAFQHQRDDEAVVAANERLEREVRERTASLRRLASQVCLAEERERRSIAENLHDHLGQALAVVKMRLQQLRGDAVFGGHGDALGELVRLSDQAIRYTRDLTFELSPPLLYELGLGAALEWLAERYGAEHGLRVRVRCRGDEDLPDDIKVMYWKSAREILHNVVKHAAAKRVRVDLEIAADVVVLEIRDDGVGFDTEAVRRRSGDAFGLFSIEERLHQLGGDTEIVSRPGEGTTISLRTPLGRFS